MHPILRRITILPALVLLAAACSDSSGPSGATGFVPGAETGIAGLLTTDAGAAQALTLADDFEGGSALANVAIEIADDGGVVLSTGTDASGRFAGDLAPGTYTVTVRLDAENEISFVVDVAEGEMLFARGKVQTTPSGKFMINLKIVRDQNGDGNADDTFTIRITGREAGAPTSGVVEIQANGENEKIAVCHAPPGNPDNEHTIVVSESSLQAHLNHGDVEGACEGDIVDDGDEPSEDESEDDDSGEKVLICHIPPGNPENAHEIEVSPDSLDDHLNHGDTEGECPDPDDDSTDDGGDGT